MVGEDYRHPLLAFEWLATIAVGTFTAPQHPLAQQGRAGQEVRGGDLAAHVQIVIADPTALSAGRDFDVLSPRTWRVNDLPAKRALITAGIGWGRLPPWAVAAEMAAGSLVALPVTGVGHRGWSRTEAYLVHRHDHPPGPATTAFVTALKRVRGTSDPATPAIREGATSGSPERTRA